MYSTCTFCHEDLGANPALERFPVGTRLAFDAERGRLWVVCPGCGRWNLSPLEERWEAIEECERRFRATRLRASTGEVGLARLPEGTELVRIGRPLRPEFAAWRYGDRFGARWRRSWLAPAALAATALGTGALAAAGVMEAAAVLPLLAWAEAARRLGAKALRAAGRGAHLGLVDDAGKRLLDRGHLVVHARLRSPAERRDDWSLEVETSRVVAVSRHILAPQRFQLHAGTALRAVAVLLAGANSAGAAPGQVRGAVRRIEEAGDPARYFSRAEREARRMGKGYADLWSMPLQIRLALEMAAHEDAERRALEGELDELRRQWREAEEIAAIADRLAVPPGVEEKLEEMRGG